MLNSTGMNNFYRVSDFAKRIGKSPTTVRRWDTEGIIVALRSKGGHRYYTDDHVRKALGIAQPLEERKTVVYCRVSSKPQKDDLASQVKAMQTFCLGAGVAVDEWIEEFGGGLNFKRPKFLKLIEEIEIGGVEHVLIAHKDRLVRFGFEFIDWLAQQHGCKITVVNQERLSPQQEMVEDLMAIIHTFSCRLYGLRSYKKRIKEAAELRE